MYVNEFQVIEWSSMKYTLPYTIKGSNTLYLIVVFSLGLIIDEWDE